ASTPSSATPTATRTATRSPRSTATCRPRPRVSSASSPPASAAGWPASPISTRTCCATSTRSASRWTPSWRCWSAATSPAPSRCASAPPTPRSIWASPPRRRSGSPPAPARSEATRPGRLVDQTARPHHEDRRGAPALLLQQRDGGALLGHRRVHALPADRVEPAAVAQHAGLLVVDHAVREGDPHRLVHV